MRFRSAAVAVLAVLALLVAVAAAQAISTPTLRTKLAAQMRHAGASSGIYVRDLDTGRTLFTSKADVARVPASVEKLYTTSTALLRFGPDFTLPTTIVGTGALDPNGVWRGDLYLHGGGDPTFSRTDLAALAAAIAGNGILRVSGSILGDESRFDALRGSFDSGGSYDRDIGGVLSALALSRGFAKNGSPAVQAAGQLAKTLRAGGIRVDGKSGQATAPDGATQLAAVDSPPMRDLIRLTNVPSDNFLAEMLVKDLGASFGGAGTTSAGVAVVRAQLASLGVHPRIVDGSGLSRVDRTTPRQVVRLLEEMHHQQVAAAFEDSLAVAGRTGTIDDRMRGTPAQDRCRAKTGTLIGVSALAGICTAAGGHQIAFAMLMNGITVGRAHRVQDHIAEAIARFDGV
jgi:D-alanyl-D-alanine carboxypeptidase/D-alanyl-D-alanine-endopeptidase (penicillin-binding protein 4)